MLGAIAGDIIGSVYEWNNIKTTDFPLFSDRSHFTDDTVMTVAVAECLISGKDYFLTFKEIGQKYPDAGYGDAFRQWLFSRQTEPNNSFGNGAAMRISPIGFFFNDLDSVLSKAVKCTNITHDHPEARKGAQAVAAAIFLARTGKTKAEIKDYVEKSFGYDLSRRLDDIRPNYKFDASCQGSVPEAIIAFLESTDYEDTVRKAVSLGGDSDTIACITGGIAEAFYKGVPNDIITKTRALLTPDLLDVVDKFYEHIK
ncbi:MAG: ADP-ribosylglycohydrolase family protein [Candidatus Magasanikbacteria bacterium]|nr:ADP-ribosylglycohydrolase family protein [Candidatus Magasanikbacteria bacterium]